MAPRAWKGMVRMRGKLFFAAGVGVGYVLGTRAGREKFDLMMARARRVWESNTMQEAAGVVQAQAGRLYDGGKRKVTFEASRLRHRTDKRRGKAYTDERDPAWEEPVGFPANSF